MARRVDGYQLTVFDLNGTLAHTFQAIATMARVLPHPIDNPASTPAVSDLDVKFASRSR